MEIVINQNNKKMKKTVMELRRSYVAPQTRVKESLVERNFLASATIPNYEEVEEEW